jgi:hypothetical protein
MTEVDLPERLRLFSDKLTPAERANFKLLLGLAAGGLAPDFKRPEHASQANAFDVVSDSLVKMQPYSARVANNGVAYRGRPTFLDDDLLSALQGEAAELRASAIRFDEHFLGCGAPLANKLSLSSELSDVVRAHAGDVQSTGVASFLYYDEPGQGIDPHIDTDIFSLNVLLMLSHRRQKVGNSCLVLLPPRSEPERLDLEEGEMVIFFAGSVAHGRERVVNGEAITVLTFGFHPLGV